jgi:hypothetical protein
VAEPVDIILLSYNRPDYLAEMVDALERRTRWPSRLTVVDNASAPETRQWLRDNAARFRQIIWNEHNEHLAAFQRGIAATSSNQFVVTDADLVVAEPTAEGCWLTRLVMLAERHPDFGLIGVRLDSVSEARNASLAQAPLVDDEILEASTGVWLNLIRRSALRVPYMSDGITCHALRRAGFRVGVAADIYVSHLGDGDAVRHPDYLARKEAASGWRTTYPHYPEVAESPSPPTLRALALAAPVLAALDRSGLTPTETIELRAPHAVLAAAEPQIVAVRGEAGTAARARVAAVVDLESSDNRIARSAFALADEWVIVLGSPGVPESPADWTLEGEYPGPHPVLLALASLASKPRWRRRLLYSTAEHREQWLAVFRAGCFGDDPALRVYVFRRTAPRTDEHPHDALEASDAGGSAGGVEHASQNPFQPPVRVRRRSVGTLVTKVRRLITAEWKLARNRGGDR